MPKPTLVLCLLALGTVAVAQEEPRNHPSRYLYGFVGQSVVVLGSEDIRYGAGMGFAYGKPERRFRFRSIPAQLIFEGYFDRTSSRFRYDNPRDTYSFGGLVSARWYWPRNEFGWGMYGDLGWGLQYANHPTRDLDSTVNSTPMIGFGGVFASGRNEYLIGLRLLHISNAGTKEPNQGQNQLFLTLGYRF
jgi:hypothetical protein